MSFDQEGGIFTNDKCSVLKLKPQYKDLYLPYLAILNSKVCWFYISKTSSEFAGGYFVFSNLFVNPFPIPNLSDSENDQLRNVLKNLVDTMLTLNQQLQEKRSRFLRRLSENIEGVKITTALQTFDKMDFAGFVAELKKQKIKLSLVQQDEWEDYFNQYHNACQELTAQISVTDNEIDNRVFDLYSLTPEEREIVMNS